MKRIYVLLLGLTPFFFGFLCQFLLITLSLPIPMLLLSLVFLLLWFFFGRLGKRKIHSSGRTLFLLNVIPFIVLILLVVQELIFGHYWANLIGGWSQLYFFPTTNLSVTLLSTLVYPILDALFGYRPIFSLVPYYVLTFLLMLLVSWLGCRTRKR